MRTSARFGAQNFGFSKFMVCVHGQGGGGGVEPAQNFCREGMRVVNFSRTSFMDGPYLGLK